jgi:hypothetical protein
LFPEEAKRLAKPVNYGDSKDWLAQGQGTNGHWRREKEWRVRGDVDFGSLDPAQVMVVTATEKEADWLRPRTDFVVKSFGCVAHSVSE